MTKNNNLNSNINYHYILKMNNINPRLILDFPTNFKEDEFLIPSENYFIEQECNTKEDVAENFFNKIRSWITYKLKYILF